uniref:Integrase catalytic domain-containing protein n=1 Tax=Cannabis sativa TaxID=3483 RepID=A0A803PXS9_CANSA
MESTPTNRPTPPMAEQRAPGSNTNQPAPPPTEQQVPVLNLAPANLPNNNLLPLNLRLDRTNFLFWRSLVLAAVRAYDLDGYILGTIQAPDRLLAGNVPNPTYQNWIRFDQFLMHWLMNSISELMLAHIINCQSSAEIWNVFNQLFATRSRASLLQVRGLLQSTKKGSMSIDEYFLKMKKYADSLAAADHPISDEDLILYILGGLGPEYESVVVNLTSRTNQLTLQEVQFMLHIRGEYGHGSQGYGRGNRGSNRGGGRSNSTNRGGRGNRPSCQLCGRVGQTTQKCYHRFDITFTGPQAPGASTSNSDNPQANLSTTNQNDDPGAAWYLDTGATHHMTPNSQQLENKEDYKGKAKVTVGNGHYIPIMHIGSNSIDTNLSNHSLILKDILHVPSISKNLLSISKFTKDNNVLLVFDSSSWFVKDKRTNQVLLHGTLSEDLYKLQLPSSRQVTHSLFPSQSVPPNNTTPRVFNCTTASNPVFDKAKTATVWHCRLGHPSKQVLQKNLSTVCPNFKYNNVEFCDSCQYGKLHQFAFKPVANKTTTPFQIVHSDVWGPHVSLDGYKYYISFLDDFTRYVWIFPMQTKSEATTIFTQFNAYVERMFETKIKSVQLDLGKEYQPLYKLFQTLGTKRNSCPHTHPQQGRVERKHWHVVDIGLTLLAQANMPLKFWWEAFTSAAYLINGLPTSVLKFVSPYEKLFQQKPDYNLFKVFGCSCFPLLRPYNNHKVSFSHSVLHFSYLTQPHCPSQYSQHGYSCQNGIHKPKTYLAHSFHELEPTSLKQALASPHWNGAMTTEFHALKRKGTWILVPFIEGMTVVSNKWVYRVKYNKDGSVDKFKARLVAKGFQQIHGLDYFKTYSPIVKPCTIRLIFSLTITYNWDIQQIDNNAFLNGELNEVVYMQQPPGFIDPEFPHHVCKLNKAIYGLKQAPRA